LIELDTIDKQRRLFKLLEEFCVWQLRDRGRTSVEEAR
jgi:hypothetical protein